MGFSSKLMETRREWDNVFKGLKGKQPVSQGFCINNEGKIHFHIKEH